MNRLLSQKIACVLLAAAMGLSTVRASAQTVLTPRIDVAGARPQPEFTPTGVRLGSWIATPELRLNQGYDSNVFGLSALGEGDAFVIATPALRLTSDWGAHGVTVTGRSVMTRYADHSALNSNEYTLATLGHLDIGETVVSLSASIDKAAERRGANGTPLTFNTPSMSRAIIQAVDVRRAAGPLVVSIGVQHQTQSFSDIERTDGVILSQSFRDSRAWSFDASASFAPTNATSFGLRAQFRHAQAQFDPERANDSATLKAVAGVDFGMIRIEGEAGYLNHRFKSPQFKDFAGLTYRGTASWYPTPLVTVTVNASRALEGSGAASVGAIVASTLSANVDYELLRNVTLHADVAQRREGFREIARTSVLRNWDIKGEYSFNRSVAFGAYARRECRDSSGTVTGRQYCASLVGVTLSMRQ